MNELENSMSRQWRFTPNAVMQVRMINFMKMSGMESKAELLRMAINYYLQAKEREVAERVLGTNRH